MKPERRTPRVGNPVTAALVAKYGVPHRLAQLAVSRGVHQRCADLADRAADPCKGFIAAANVLASRREPRGLPPLEALLAPS